MNCPACSVGTLIERPQVSTLLRDAYVCDHCKRGFAVPNTGCHGLQWLSPLLSVLTLGLLDLDVDVLE